MGENFFKVLEIEPMLYEFTEAAGFTNGDYPVPDIIPPKNYLYYIVSVGVNGGMSFRINYPSGQPRQTPTANALQRVDQFQAPYLNPWTFQFIVKFGDSMEVSVNTGGILIAASLWFYGWKIRVKELGDTPPSAYMQLPDIRRIVT